MSATSVRLRNHLGRILYQRGWSDGQLAQLTGMTRLRVNRVKNRRSEPSVGEVLLIAHVLEVSPENIFFLEDTRDRQSAARRKASEMFDALRSRYESAPKREGTAGTPRTKS